MNIWSAGPLPEYPKISFWDTVLSATTRDPSQLGGLSAEIFPFNSHYHVNRQ